MANIINYLTQTFLTPTTLPVQQQTPVEPTAPTNPFSQNPFVSLKATTSTMENYAKNRPVKGGYFAGYYNNKPNIVGQRLFLEV